MAVKMILWWQLTKQNMINSAWLWLRLPGLLVVVSLQLYFKILWLFLLALNTIETIKIKVKLSCFCFLSGDLCLYPCPRSHGGQCIFRQHPNCWILFLKVTLRVSWAFAEEWWCCGCGLLYTSNGETFWICTDFALQNYSLFLMQPTHGFYGMVLVVAMKLSILLMIHWF